DLAVAQHRHRGGEKRWIERGARGPALRSPDRRSPSQELRHRPFPGAPAALLRRSTGHARPSTRLLSASLAVIRNMFLDPKQRAVAIGVWISSFSAGAVIGPPLGGFLLEYFWWGSVFLVSVPMMVLLLVLGPTLLPEFRDPNAGRPDLPSAILSVAAVLAVIYGLKQIAAHGVGSRALLCSPLV